MEAGAVARAAEARGVEFRVVKVISDEVDFSFPSMENFVDSEGRFLESRFAWFCALRPWLWAGVLQLARNSSLAAQALSAWFRKMAAETAAVSSTTTLEAVNRR